MYILYPIIKLIKSYILKNKISIWTGAPIINLAINAKAERLLGIQSYSLVSNVYFISEKFDFVLSKFCKYKIIIFFLRYLSCFLICIFASKVHAYVDGGILPQKKFRSFNDFEIRLYKLFSIDLFIWTFGADVRTRTKTINLGRVNCCTDCSQIGKACVCNDDLFNTNYQILLKNSKAIFAMGDMAEYTPGSINNLFFWPVNLYENENLYIPHYPLKKSLKPLRIVHATNHS